MVTISTARNAVSLSTYHEKELTNASENYYTGNARIEGEWRGRLAAKWGLSGPVSSEHFTRLSEGQHPITGEALIRHRLKSEKSVAHRAGWDATFSAPNVQATNASFGLITAQANRPRTIQVGARFVF